MDAGQTQELELPAPPPPAAPGPPSGSRGPWLQFRFPRAFEWNRYEIPIAALPPQLHGIRIAHLTDLHFKKSWSEVYQQIIDRVRHEAPDLILMTGDFVDNKRNHLPALPHVRRLLEGLRAPLGCFGILGNHDRYALGPRLDNSGITLIDGRQHVIDVDGAELELIGLPGVDRDDVTQQVIQSYPLPRRGVPRIILSHFPDVLRDAAVLRPDLFLAGHTHGGQICFPGGYPILRHDSLPRRLCTGVHRAASTWLVVSRGLGFTGLPWRVFCPAEVVELTLSRG